MGKKLNLVKNKKYGKIVLHKKKEVKSMNKKPIVALIYDFDKTLCPKDMQEYGFIETLGLDAPTFWAETSKLADRENMDKILAYMFQMNELSNQKNQPLTKEMFSQLGKNIEFFPGVKEWFLFVNQKGTELGLMIEHYIISSGLKEIIEGTTIAKEFKEIYACEFLYNAEGKAIWAKTAVNYTTKTQFLFRISKGVLDATDDIKINQLIPNEKRRIAFENMVYIGDGMTDIPCMRLVKERGGHSIAVYPFGHVAKVKNLLVDERVNFICPANYQVGSDLEQIISIVLQEIACKNQLNTWNQRQKSLKTEI